ncbi:uricase [Cladophialophora bantiana CBS 173.52]|uniref:Uricase n=1 Tax=Cladophialophora bantiana (strain ATCC 10958 / CBS 173.52 / CDC B-1940 / NIH 8579) TaxID=1442370 RepID=A0A0D2HLE6_CLAB1|nr:uricase [Cladophialophora bantiana CBS 173.52]KIW91575.1 uricase [Cladophialophora bantiana CBS 173.52]
MAKLAAARYGKDNVRLYKVERDEATKTHTVYEMTVCVLLEGEIDVSYTKADNSVVVATDSMKNTTYIMAKQNPVHPPELFASILGTHFVNTYKHIHTAHISIVQHRWTRMTIDGKPHPHSFFRDGNEKRLVQADIIEGKGIEIKSSISDLLVLKSTGSEFHHFVRDEFTTLPEVWDRILSTSVDANWKWSTFAGLDAVKKYMAKFDETWAKAREITFRLFALEESPSVQNTMYKMCEQILAAQPMVQAVDYSLPNKHYFEIDLSWHHGLKNTGKDAEVYAPQSDPNGLIKCTVTRDDTALSSKL